MSNLKEKFFYVNPDATPATDSSEQFARTFPVSNLIAMYLSEGNYDLVLAFEDSGTGDHTKVNIKLLDNKGKESMEEVVKAINSGQSTMILGDETKKESIISYVDWSDEAVTISQGTAGTFALDGALTVAGSATFNGGIKRFVKLTSTASILEANSGIPHLIGPAAAGLAAASVFTLPTPANGLYYKFIYVGGATDAHATTIDTGSSDNFYIGGMTHFDTDSGPNNAGTPILLYSDNNSNRKIVMTIPGAGSYVEVFCDGTNWFASGAITSTSSDLSTSLFVD